MRQESVVELQDKSRVDDRLIFFPQRLGERDDDLLVVFVETH